MKLFYVDSVFKTELEVKKSKFISFLIPYTKFDEVMAKLRSEHPKARHFVYAYRYLNEYEQIVENQSDDGEPKNSSGKPTLNVMQGNGLINSAIITVRYFGGIKLGVGGLVRAYGDSANLAINETTLSEYVKREVLIFSVEYSNLSRIEYIMNNYKLEANKDFLVNGVKLSLEVPQNEIDKFKNEIKGYVTFSPN